MGVNNFKFSIEVEGHEQPSKTVEFQAKFPSRLKKMGVTQMADWVRQRTQEGVGVDGKPFAPLATGQSTNLVRTGAMLAAIKASKQSELKGNDAIAAIGVTCGLNEHYPWIVNNGVDPDVHRGKIVAKIERKIDRKQARLDRKMKKWRMTSELTEKWEVLQETIFGIQDDLRKLRLEWHDAMDKKVIGMPARPWWGLIEPERERLYTALKGWLASLVSGSVATACNPVKNTPEAAEKDAAEAFERGLRGETVFKS